MNEPTNELMIGSMEESIDKSMVKSKDE